MWTALTWLSVALISWALAFVAYCALGTWKRIKIADAMASRAIAAADRAQALQRLAQARAVSRAAGLQSEQVRMFRESAERLSEQVEIFQKLTGAHTSDNLAPVSPEKIHLIKSENVIPLPFGKRKPSDQPEGAA